MPLLGSTWHRRLLPGAGEGNTEPCPWLLPLCHGRQGTAAAPMPGQLQTLVSYFKEHFK